MCLRELIEAIALCEMPPEVESQLQDAEHGQLAPFLTRTVRRPAGVLFRKHRCENVSQSKDAILAEQDRFTPGFADIIEPSHTIIFS